MIFLVNNLRNSFGVSRAFVSILWYHCGMKYKIEPLRKIQLNYSEMSIEQLKQIAQTKESEIIELNQQLSNFISMIRLNNQKFG